MTSLRAAAPSSTTSQVDAILEGLKNQLIQDGLGDSASVIIPALQKIEQAPNAASAVLQLGVLLPNLLAELPVLETQALQQVAAAGIAIFRIYVPATT